LKARGQRVGILSHVLIRIRADVDQGSLYPIFPQRRETIPSFKLSILGKPVTVDLDQDYYSVSFWQKVNNSLWEPDTLSFIRGNCDANTVFLDIGAANGAITLAAAICGAETHSFEPDPVIYGVLKRNVEINSEYSNLIHLNHSAVSIEQAEIEFSMGSNPEILSDILFRHQDFKKTKTKVVSLAQELNRVAKVDSALVVKMDIEGAEFIILNDERTLYELAKFNSKLLLAIHPGFNRVYEKSRIHRKISEKRWRIRNINESRKLFENVSKYAKVKRTNLNPVHDEFIFSRLVDSGYHEFILDFDSAKR
jgi:FkbM family methyltransferase